MRFSQQEFEILVAEALESLPDEVMGWLDNVAIIVGDRPTPQQYGRILILER